MKNVTLIAIFTLTFGQFVWAQNSEQRRGIGAWSGNNDEETRKALRCSGNSSGGEEAGKELASKCLSSQEGRAECGRPSQGGRENSQKGGNSEQGGEKKKHQRHPIHHHHNLLEIFKKELGLTEEQDSKLRVIHTELHEAVKEIRGGKKFCELSEDEKDRLSDARHKFRAARAEILSEEQLVQLKLIHAKHHEGWKHAKKECGCGEGGRGEGPGGGSEQDGRDSQGRPDRRGRR